MSGEDTLRVLASAIKRAHKLRVTECFDPVDLSSRPTPKQLEILKDINKIPCRWVVSGNQAGKSQTGAREASWIFTETHPFWTRPASWGTEPLQLIICTRTHTQLEENVWRKLKALIPAGTYKETRQGSRLTKITNTENENSILFLSAHSSDEAREKMQGFVAHYVWIDEMPGTVELIEELRTRVLLRGGYFLATFTPKVRNDRIRKLVDAATPPFAKKYRMSMFDNPALTDEAKAGKLEELKSYSEAYKNTCLYGDWSGGDTMVYNFSAELHCSKRPEHYSRAWRHVVSTDPASSSKFGFTLWAEDPRTGVWYCVAAEAITGAYAPSDIVREVETRLDGYNIVRRVVDSHESWFRHESYKVTKAIWMAPVKANRKDELILGLQQALTDSRVKICDFCEHLIDEFVECHRDEDSGKIVASSKFHLLDTAQYFVDAMPPREKNFIPETRDAAILQAHNERKVKESKKGSTLMVQRRDAWRRSRRYFL